MSTTYLYSLVLDLRAQHAATLPATMGHQAHALFLDLIRQGDPALAARLHDEPNYRPFTVSPLLGIPVQDGQVRLRSGHACSLRFTLLDGGPLWEHLITRFLVTQTPTLRLGAAEFLLGQVRATPGNDPTGWAGYTDWPTLAATPARPYLTLRFASPTAFNFGDKRFILFPEPLPVWDSLLRVWNLYAPPPLQIDKAPLREFITRAVVVADYELHTTRLQYPNHIQKGFVGTCTYRVQEQDALAAQITALAEFARYAGIGYKTTMGMGQVRAEAEAQKDTSDARHSRS